jgi:hypothetical protein
MFQRALFGALSLVVASAASAWKPYRGADRSAVHNTQRRKSAQRISKGRGTNHFERAMRHVRSAFRAPA